MKTLIRLGTLASLAVAATAVAQIPVMSPEFQVSQNTSSYQSNYGVAMDDAGRFVVTWLNDFNDAGDCTARLFDANGAPVSGQFAVSPSATDQFKGPVAKDASGRFVVAWYEGDSVMARRFQPNGLPIGTAFTVTTSATNDVFVASDDAGNFVVTWSRFTPGSDIDVFARRYDSAGAPVGTEFPVNTYTTAFQQARGVAMKGLSGQFVINWVGNGPGGPGIWARSFDADGNSTGAIQVNQGDIPNVCPSPPSPSTAWGNSSWPGRA